MWERHGNSWERHTDTAAAMERHTATEFLFETCDGAVHELQDARLLQLRRFKVPIRHDHERRVMLSKSKGDLAQLRLSRVTSIYAPPR